MDRYPNLEYTVLLDERTLARLGNLHFLLHIFKTQSRKHLLSFWLRCRGEFLFHHGVYANINTKYFFGTSDICFDLISYTFEFSFVKNFDVHESVCDETVLKILFLWILRLREL